MRETGFSWRSLAGLAVVALGVAAVAAGFRGAGAGPAAGGRAAVVRYNLMGESIGLAGYDPVSYFPEGGGVPLKGLIGLTREHDGVTWRFASKENQARFAQDPGKYLPRYGGWCAWAVAELGKRVDVDPESYLVRDGRLLVFYRDRELDTRALFLERPDELSRKAEANWPKLAR